MVRPQANNCGQIRLKKASKVQINHLHARLRIKSPHNYLSQKSGVKWHLWQQKTCLETQIALEHQWLFQQKVYPFSKADRENQDCQKRPDRALWRQKYRQRWGLDLQVSCNRCHLRLRSQKSDQNLQKYRHLIRNHLKAMKLKFKMIKRSSENVKVQFCLQKYCRRPSLPLLSSNSRLSRQKDAIDESQELKEVSTVEKESIQSSSKSQETVLRLQPNKQSPTTVETNFPEWLSTWCLICKSNWTSLPSLKRKDKQASLLFVSLTGPRRACQCR